MITKAMRDAFFDRLYELARTDKDIVVISADLGAPSLDAFRRDFPSQFINVGISEQNAVLLATGLALRNKKPIVYAITQFITLRCYEQMRIYPCGMKIPVTLVGVGAGVCYSESGPTHHSIEDLTVMRSLPNLQIYNSSDSVMARKLADIAITGDEPKFIRLDRDLFDNVSEGRDFKEGFSAICDIGDITIIATGNMVHIAKEISVRMTLQGHCIGVIDVFKMPMNESVFLEKIKSCRQLITLEEHTLRGGFSSYILEVLNDAEVYIPVKRLGFHTDHGYQSCYNYGGREAICSDFGMGIKDIFDLVKRYCV